MIFVTCTQHNQASSHGITDHKEENTVFREKHTTSTILLNAQNSEVLVFYGRNFITCIIVLFFFTIRQYL